MTVDANRVRGFLLDRQGLRHPFEGPIPALDALFAVQTQYAFSLPIAIAARSVGSKVGWDEKALRSGADVKSWSVRTTLHAHTPECHRTMISAVGARMNERYLEWMRRARLMNLDDVTAMQDRICEALAAEPLTRADLHRAVPGLRDMPMVGWGVDVMGLSLQGRLAIVGSERGSALFGLMDPPELMDERKARVALLSHYLKRYGPATAKDFAYWSGLRVGEVAPLLSSLEDKVSSVEIEGVKARRLALTEDLQAIQAAEPPCGVVSLLAKFDPLTMGHHDKSIFLDGEHRTRVFRKAGQVEAVVLIDGVMRAAWRLERKSKKSIVRIEPFGKILRKEKAGIERSARKLGSALGTDIAVEFGS